MKTMSAALKAAYAAGTTTFCTCVKATLRNGTVVATTTRQRSFDFDGDTYLATAGYTASDIESSAELNPDNLEIEGFLASPAITDADIYSGIWDHAAIEMFEVNYADLTMGRNLLRSGTLGEVKGGRSKFTAELRGLMQKLSRHIVNVTTKECQNDLGDSRCQVALGPLTVTGSVTTATSQRQFTDATRAEAAEHFTGGLLTWTGGLNAGLSMEVKQSTGAGAFELHQAMPFAVQVGDTYSVYAGCTKRFTEDCVGKFNNGVNFNGFPHLPLSAVYDGPSSV